MGGRTLERAAFYELKRVAVICLPGNANRQSHSLCVEHDETTRPRDVRTDYQEAISDGFERYKTVYSLGSKSRASTRQA